MPTETEKQNDEHEYGYQHYQYEVPPENHLTKNVYNNNNDHRAHYNHTSQEAAFLAGTHQKIKLRDAIPQIMASIIAFMIVIQAGVNMAYSSVIIQQLNETNSPISITTDEASWIASLVTITLPIGALFTGPIMDRYGRKTLALMSCLPFIVAWIMIGTANSIYVIYLARIIAGAAGGLTNVALVYVSEITHPTLRPMMLSFNSVFVSLGILITSGLSLFLDWRALAFFYCGMVVVTLFITFIIPESPHWIKTFKPDRNDKFRRSMKWIYRDDSLYEQQLQQLIGTATQPIKGSVKFNFQDLNEKIVYKPLFILLILLLFQQLSGVYAIIFYALNIFVKIRQNFDGITDYQALLLLGLLRFIMSIVAALASRNFGRRTMMCVSGTGMSLCTLLAGVTMFFSAEQNYAAIHQEIVLLICILGFVCFGSLGYLVIPWALTTELLPTKVKATLSGLMIGVGYVVMFAVIKIFPYALEWFGIQGIFFVLSLTSILGVIFVYLYLPETLGRSFSEIEKYFR